MKKTKMPGDNFSLKTKKTEDPAVMNWINTQSNLMDSLRYLIENEIVQNGVRNLQAVVPAERNVLSSSIFKGEGTAQPVSAERDNEAAAARRELAAAQQVDESRLTERVLADGALPLDGNNEPERWAEPEPTGDEEIDDDDIESWV